MKGLQIGSCKTLMLKELFFFTGITKSYLLQNGYEYAYSSQCLSWLIKKGYVGTATPKDLRRAVCFLTRAGYKLLADQDESYRVSDEKWDAMRFKENRARSIVRIGDTAHFIKTYGFLVCGDERLTFDDFLKPIQTGESSFDNDFGYRFDIKNLAQSGVFFPSREIRPLIQPQNTRDEIAETKNVGMWRSTGILLFGGKIYIVYNTMERMMKWISHHEKEYQEAIQNLLGGYSGFINTDSKNINAIVFGKHQDLTKKLIWGNSDTPPEITERTGKRKAWYSEREFNTEEKSAALLYSKTASFFEHIYYVPVGNDVTEEQDRLWQSLLQEEEVDRAEDKRFEAFGWVWMPEGFKRGFTERGTAIYRITHLDIMELTTIRERTRENFTLITHEIYLPLLKELYGNRIEEIYLYENYEMLTFHLATGENKAALISTGENGFHR